AIPRRGGAAALHVAEHGDACLEARPLLDLPPERLTDAAPREDHMPELILLAPVREPRQLAAFADDDDGEVLAARVARTSPSSSSAKAASCRGSRTGSSARSSSSIRRSFS